MPGHLLHHSLTAGRDLEGPALHITRECTNPRCRPTDTESGTPPNSGPRPGAHCCPPAGTWEEMQFPLHLHLPLFKALNLLSLGPDPRWLLWSPEMAELTLPVWPVQSCLSPHRTSHDSISLRSKLKVLTRGPKLPRGWGWGQNQLSDLISPPSSLQPGCATCFFCSLRAPHLTCLRGFALAISSVPNALSSNSLVCASLLPLGLCSDVPTTLHKAAPLAVILSSPPAFLRHSTEHHLDY